MSYHGITDYSPDRIRAASKVAKIKKTIVANFYEERDLRKNYPSLRNAWEQYQIVLQLVKESNNARIR